MLEQIPEKHRKCVIDILKQDPRPSYIEDESRVYGVLYGGYNIRFRVQRKNLMVIEVEKMKRERQ